MLSVRNKYYKVSQTKKLLKSVLRFSSTATQPAKLEDETEKQLKEFETLINISKKIRTKLPQKPPFAKNLFLGIFDTDLLAYPELEKETLLNLESNAKKVEKLIGQQHMIDCESIANKNFRQNLADYKAIGLQASQFLDGQECNVTESSRILEALSSHKLRDNIIYNEQLGIQTLVKYAGDELKKKYLHRLMKGESLSAFCISEAVSAQLSSLKTKATISNDQKSWILNGTKTWVVNGKSADVLIVFALTDLINKGDIKEARITAFVVERDFPGITYQEKDTDLEIADVTFNDVVVPAANIIGEVHKAEPILKSIMSEFRLSTGPACVTLTKNILNNLTKSILEQSNDINLLHKTDAIRGKMGEMITQLYAMESVLYMTTGLLDSYENQDCELESIIVKVFCSENCANISMKALDMIGVPAMSKSHWANEYHNEALRYFTLQETNDSLKIITALLGLQYAGTHLNDIIKKLRNPLFHATFILKRLWYNSRHNNDNPKLDLELKGYLHPSCMIAADYLEYCVKRLQYITEVILMRYGPELVNKHINLRRLADCIIDIYVMTACLSRASRSYCIGLQSANLEINIATCYCIRARERIKDNVNKIYIGEDRTTDESYRLIAKNIFKFKEYYPKHPLSRNF